MIGEHQHFHGPNGTLAQGRIVEDQISQWLIRAQGWILLPPYEIEIPSRKGPRLSTPNGELIVPDLLGMRYKGRKFVLKWWEAKGKSRFTWHRNSGNWQTGIDLRHYEDYIEVQKQTFEVYVCFLHKSSTPSKSDLDYGSPAICPTGLFGNTLSYLMAHEHHKDKYFNGRRDCPMVYWNESDLERLATLEEVQTLPISLWKGMPA
jgi:hypothetical protein